MKNIIETFIPGRPAPLKKRRGNKETPKNWKDAVIAATQKLPKVSGPCKMEIIFNFGQNQYPKDFPYGPDIDNYLKSTQDALGETIFSKVMGGDSAIVRLIASKKKAKGEECEGAQLRIWQYKSYEKN